MSLSFSEMYTTLSDRLGLTTVDSNTETRLVRCLNRGKDRHVHSAQWPWLETTANQLFTSGTRVYQATVDAEHVLSIEGPDGTPLRVRERDEYDRLYRPSTATATVPLVYAIQGRQDSGAWEFHVWPQPSSNTTGAIRYVGHPTNITATATSSGYTFVPDGHDHAILKAAEAEFWDEENDPNRAGLAEQKYMELRQRLAGELTEPVPEDGAEK